MCTPTQALPTPLRASDQIPSFRCTSSTRSTRECLQHPLDAPEPLSTLNTSPWPREHGRYSKKTPPEARVVGRRACRLLQQRVCTPAPGPGAHRSRYSKNTSRKRAWLAAVPAAFCSNAL